MLLVLRIWRTDCFKAHVHQFASHTQATAKVCSLAYMLKNSQVWQFIKYLISSTLCTHVRDLSGPAGAALKSWINPRLLRFLVGFNAGHVLI